MKISFPSHIPFEFIVKRFGTPVYVYDLDEIKNRIDRLKKALPSSTFDLFYSIKANPILAILKIVRESGIGVDACSTGDLWLAEKTGFTSSQITFTGVALNNQLISKLHKKNIRTNLDSVSELKKWCALSPPQPVGLRVAPDVKAGFSEHCRGGLWGGKLGIALDDVPSLIRQARKYNVIIHGLHMHIGSGILDIAPFIDAIERLLPIFKQFNQLEYLNIGGGLGTSYHDEEDEIPIEYLGQTLSNKIEQFLKHRETPLRLQAEPGEFITAPAGYILTRVMVKKIWKRNNEIKQILILDASMNHYPGGTLYNSTNRIYLLRDPDAQPTHEYDIFGNTNQSGDRFGRTRYLPEIKEGDILIIGSCGAYASSRSSTFNEHLLAPEVVVSKGKIALATRGQTYEELFNRMKATLVWYNDDEPSTK